VHGVGKFLCSECVNGPQGRRFRRVSAGQPRTKSARTLKAQTLRSTRKITACLDFRDLRALTRMQPSSTNHKRGDCLSKAPAERNRTLRTSNLAHIQFRGFAAARESLPSGSWCNNAPLVRGCPADTRLCHRPHPPALSLPLPLLFPGYLCCMFCMFCMPWPIPFIPMPQFCGCVCANSCMSCPIICSGLDSDTVSPRAKGAVSHVLVPFDRR